GNVDLDPCLLQRITEIGRETFDCGDLLAGGVRNTLHTRADRLSVQVNCAGAAESHTTAVLSSGQAQRFAQHPEQRRARVGIDREFFAVDSKSNHWMTPLLTYP